MCDALFCGTMVLYSVNFQNSQQISDNNRLFAARLREDRLRVCPKQLDFAEISGLQNTEISALEKGKVKIRADHLAQLAKAGIDILYVITGQRGGEMLDARESLLFDAFRSLDDVGQATVLLVVAKMAPAQPVHFTPKAVIDEVSRVFASESGRNVFDPSTGSAEFLRKAQAQLHDQARGFKGEEE